jgi:hypothetical protein
MGIVIECDKIAVDRKATADSRVKRKPVLCTRSHDSV